jgi:hypothetical protein
LACSVFGFEDQLLGLFRRLSGALVLEPGVLGFSLGRFGLSLKIGKIVFRDSQAFLRLG